MADDNTQVTYVGPAGQTSADLAAEDPDQFGTQLEPGRTYKVSKSLAERLTASSVHFVAGSGGKQAAALRAETQRLADERASQPAQAGLENQASPEVLNRVGDPVDDPNVAVPPPPSTDDDGGNNR